MQGSINDFTASPQETINDVTSHDDNFTLWDKIAQSNPDEAEADRIKMDELAQAKDSSTAQAIAFLHGGERCCVQKVGNCNNYNAGDACQSVRLVALKPATGRCGDTMLA